MTREENRKVGEKVSSGRTVRSCHSRSLDLSLAEAVVV
jgi:hypothetical protein